MKRPHKFRPLLIHSVFLALFVCFTSILTTFAQDDADVVALFRQAQDAHEKGELKQAIILYEKVLEAAPDLPEAEYQIGSAYLALGDIDDAEAAFRKAIEVRPDWSLPMAALGDILVRRSKFAKTSADARRLYAEATTTLRKAIELDANNIPAWAALVDLQIAAAAGDATYKESLASLRNLSDGKMNVPASLWIARAALERILHDKSAINSLRKALASDPTNKFALSSSVEMALENGDVELARTTLDDLTKRFPNDDAVKVLNARVLASENKFADALKELDSITNLDPEGSQLKRQLTASAAQNAADLESRLASDEKNAAILGRLCTLYRVDAPDKALDYCRRANEAEPSNIVHAIGFAGALVQSKKYEQAISLLKKLIELAPDNTTAHAFLATAYFQLKAYLPARDEYQWLIDHNSGVPIAYYLIGIVHDELGAYLDAVANYQLFLKYADPTKNQLEIDKVNLRMPAVQKLARGMKRK